MAPCVWHDACVELVAQVKLTEGAAVTVNTAEQVLFASQLEVTVHVTVFEPPHLSGALPPLLDIIALHPPVKVAEFSQAV